MRYLLPLLLVNASILCRADEPETWHYCGEIDKQAICMDIEYGAQPRAVYFFVSDMQDKFLTASLPSPRQIVLTNRHEKFDLKLEEYDPRGGFGKERLDKEVLTGTWSDGHRTLPVYLSVESGGSVDPYRYGSKDSEESLKVEGKIRQLFNAILRKDSSLVAQSLVLPVRVPSEKGGLRVIKTQEAFISQFSRIFPASQLECLRRNAVPHRMFSNYQGIMLANGAIWFDFDGNVETINGCALPHRENENVDVRHGRDR